MNGIVLSLMLSSFLPGGGEADRTHSLIGMELTDLLKRSLPVAVYMHDKASIFLLNISS